MGEDCVDQLSVLGRIMPATYEELPNADEVVDSEISALVDGQLSLESRYEEVLSKKTALKGTGKSITEQRTEMTSDLKNISADLKNSTHTLARGLKQNPLTPDNLEKVQQDRAFLERV